MRFAGPAALLLLLTHTVSCSGPGRPVRAPATGGWVAVEGRVEGKGPSRAVAAAATAVPAGRASGARAAGRPPADGTSAMTVYLRSVSPRPLLNSEQELALATSLQEALRLRRELSVLSAELGRPALPAEEVARVGLSSAELGRRLREGEARTLLLSLPPCLSRSPCLPASLALPPCPPASFPPCLSRSPSLLLISLAARGARHLVSSLPISPTPLPIPPHRAGRARRAPRLKPAARRVDCEAISRQGRADGRPWPQEEAPKKNSTRRSVSSLGEPTEDLVQEEAPKKPSSVSSLGVPMEDLVQEEALKKEL